MKEKDLDNKFYGTSSKVPNAFVKPKVEDMHAGKRAEVAKLCTNWRL